MGDDRKKKKAFSLSSSHRDPHAFIFPFPQPLYDTKRPLPRGKRMVFDNSVTMINITDRFSNTVVNKPAKIFSI